MAGVKARRLLEIRHPVIRLDQSGYASRGGRQKGRSRTLSPRYRLIFALFSVPFFVFAFFLYGGPLATRAYMDEASAQAGTALRLAVSALSGHLSRYEALPALIADHDDIKELVAASGRPRHAQGGEPLPQGDQRAAEIVGHLRDYAGRRDDCREQLRRPGSFVGQNFSYRPYFQDAVAGPPVALLCARHHLAETRLLFRLPDHSRRQDQRRHRLQGRYRYDRNLVARRRIQDLRIRSRRHHLHVRQSGMALRRHPAA